MIETGIDVYLFSVLTAISWGLAAVIAKRGLTNGGSPLFIALLGTFFGTIIFWIVLFGSVGSAVFERLTPTVVWIFLLSGFIGTAAGRLLYYGGIQRVGATIGDAAANTNPLIATVLALIVIGEPITIEEFSGMLVVVVGLIVLSRSKGGDVSGWTLQDLAFPLAAAVAFGVGQMLRRYGFVVTQATPFEAAALNATAGAVGVAAYIVSTRQFGALVASRNALAYFVAAGLLVAVGMLSVMVALSLGRVVVVVPIVGTVPLFTVAFSYLFLEDIERITRGMVLGVAAIVFGIYLLTGIS